MALETLFAAIVADLTLVRDAYEAAGLLRDSGHGSAAWTLFGGADGAERFRRDTLLADALVRNRVARLVFRRQGPSNIVVFGGNNVGKSTVVNVLAAATVAGTSPEGGHTRHAHAFTADPGALFAWNPYAFNRFRQVPSSQLAQSGFDGFAVSTITSDTLPPDITLWDSPDCDSVGSGRYLAAVVETATAADLIVYVTSVEKYAVNDLVEWLFDLTEAGIPILGCLNKTPRKDRALVMRRHEEDILPAVSRRLNRPAPSIRMVALRTMTEGEEADLWGADHPEAAELRDAAVAGAAPQDDAVAGRAALQAASERIDRVLEPARAELAVRAAWTETVGGAVAAFVATYESEYLTGDSVIDPFTKLNVQLLDLLNPEIPGLSEVMRGLRKIRRLPADLLKAGWRFISERTETVREADLAPELRAYAHAHRALLRAIHDRIDAERGAPRHHPFWDRLAVVWQQRAADLAEDFRRATERHMEQTDAEIRSAARDILKALEQRPGVLRLLRTVRLSTEMGGLLVGFAIPGHGHIGHDLLDRVVIAPLMMSATGAAADFAVEGYVAQRRSQIVEKLRAEARTIATGLYAAPLHAIGEEVFTAIGTLGLPQALLDRLPANLDRLRHAADRLA
ncbi:MAG TPA: GTPase domain-containing protein [Rhodopila sp.]|nr:GTPase domain-containing protein [Rhodopila sp.]